MAPLTIWGALTGGGVTSALCFALYINDLPAEMSSRVLLYADDAKVFRKINLSERLRKLTKRSRESPQMVKTWNLQLNPSKCKSFRITLKVKPLVTSYYIGNTVLEHVEEIRDLGGTLDTKLNFGPHVNQTVVKANRALGVLIRSYQRATPRGHLNVSAVQSSYFAYVRSNLEYCSVIWNGAAAGAHCTQIGLGRIEHKFLM